MSALTQITARAKKIRRLHKSTSWKAAIKKASAEYRAKHKAPKKKAARKKVSGPGKIKRRKIIRAARKSHAIEGRYLDKLQSIGAVKAAGKKLVRSKLANALVSREMATTKTAKKKAAKHVAALKKNYRTFC